MTCYLGATSKQKHAHIPLSTKSMAFLKLMNIRCGAILYSLHRSVNAKTWSIFENCFLGALHALLNFRQVSLLS